MIASQKIGKSFMGALSYNLKKLAHPDPKLRAELLETNFTSMDKGQIKQEVELLRMLRPNLNRYVYHTSLNFSNEDRVQNTQALSIALQYLEANGFTNNQYFIFRHYDAEHPHLHLLVNRICFDGNVVSDSNNYKRSEEILRRIERQYDLVQLSPSKSTPVRAATKNELEMVIRTGKPSDKMLLQEKLSLILKQQNRSIQDFIQHCQANGIHLLFNQQSTGRISGITYCHEGLTIKGQKLGNKFKWSELIKKLNYEQIRDGKAISEANGRTRTKYGITTVEAGRGSLRQGGDGLAWSDTNNLTDEHRQRSAIEEIGNETIPYREGSLEANTAADLVPDSASDINYNRFDEIHIEIADDEDDARYRRRRRGR